MSSVHSQLSGVEETDLLARTLPVGDCGFTAGTLVILSNQCAHLNIAEVLLYNCAHLCFIKDSNSIRQQYTSESS